MVFDIPWSCLKCTACIKPNRKTVISKNTTKYLDQLTYFMVYLENFHGKIGEVDPSPMAIPCDAYPLIFAQKQLF